MKRYYINNEKINVHITEWGNNDQPVIFCLLRATVPEIWDEYRGKTASIFSERTRATVKLIPDSTHLLHWDYPEVIVEEIKNHW